MDKSRKKKKCPQKSIIRWQKSELVDPKWVCIRNLGFEEVCKCQIQIWLASKASSDNDSLVYIIIGPNQSEYDLLWVLKLAH